MEESGGMRDGDWGKVGKELMEGMGLMKEE